jgi:hypothetical protein
MESMNLDERSVADGATDQSRREAPQRFGRYAAAAPTAMVLLEPRGSIAAKRGGKGKRKGKGKGKDDGY